ncbi:hypothetical protein GCM10022254_12530 [Actinomadura meridiana]|uniref:Uncharacterized protein n=1 Tax=Actinomadura meridiana TaxID=559626 RepID=A0ABP8BUK3_9ACTN
MFRTHEMRKTRTEESGREEWACPTCGRRILLRWPPNYEKQIVEPGDQRACHVGSSADDTPAEPPDTPLPAQDVSDEQRWHSARRWLRETGVDSLPSSPPASPPAPPTPTPVNVKRPVPPPPAGTRLGPSGAV